MSTLRFTVASDLYDANDERWEAQVQGLLDDLKANAGPVSKETSAEAGTKGGAETIILALGTAGAINAAVTIFKAWLGSRGRRVQVGNVVVTVDGDISDELIAKAMDMSAAQKSV